MMGTGSSLLATAAAAAATLRVKNGRYIRALRAKIRPFQQENLRHSRLLSAAAASATATLDPYLTASTRNSMVVTSAEQDSRKPACCTFTAKGRPSRLTALCTCKQQHSSNSRGLEAFICCAWYGRRYTKACREDKNQLIRAALLMQLCLRYQGSAVMSPLPAISRGLAMALLLGSPETPVHHYLEALQILYSNCKARTQFDTAQPQPSQCHNIAPTITNSPPHGALNTALVITHPDTDLLFYIIPCWTYLS
jgi:hypothetical protein